MKAKKITQSFTCAFILLALAWNVATSHSPGIGTKKRVEVSTVPTETNAALSIFMEERTDAGDQLDPDLLFQLIFIGGCAFSAVAFLKTVPEGCVREITDQKKPLFITNRTLRL